MTDDVLLAYAKAMRSAQRMEGRIKTLLGLSRLLAGVATSPGPLSDVEFESLLNAGDKKTFGKALEGVLEKLPEFGLSALPTVVVAGLRKTVIARNFLAHHYFARRSLCGDTPDVRSLLVAELSWFSELFEAWIPRLDKWQDILLGACGISPHEIKLAEKEMDSLVPDLRSDALSDLKEVLRSVGIDVSSPPAGLPNPALNPTGLRPAG